MTGVARNAEMPRISDALRNDPWRATFRAATLV
jgi:hypothetical protein